MSDDKTKLQELNKLVFKDQAIWMLNAIWPEMQDSKAEDIWNLRNIFAEFEMVKYRTARKRLIETFRYALNVPLLSK